MVISLFMPLQTTLSVSTSFQSPSYSNYLKRNRCNPIVLQQLSSAVWFVKYKNSFAICSWCKIPKYHKQIWKYYQQSHIWNSFNKANLFGFQILFLFLLSWQMLCCEIFCWMNKNIFFIIILSWKHRVGLNSAVN